MMTDPVPGGEAYVDTFDPGEPNAGRKPIQEEDGIHREWYDRARKMTVAELPGFIRELTEDYGHDYGTICHAIAAAALGAAWAVEQSPQGGITGFQAGAIQWEFIRNWDESLKGESLRLIRFSNLLYPQYEYLFNSIPQSAWEEAQAKARELVAAGRETHEYDGDDGVKRTFTTPVDAVWEHWQGIAAGEVPFGLIVIPNESDSEAVTP